MNKDIYLTNNLSNKKEKFVPQDKENIGMYVCGPTVYDNPHIGNARPLVIFDILYKVLKSKYGNDKINYVRNITDVWIVINSWATNIHANIFVIQWNKFFFFIG